MDAVARLRCSGWLSLVTGAMLIVGWGTQLLDGDRLLPVTLFWIAIGAGLVVQGASRLGWRGEAAAERSRTSQAGRWRWLGRAGVLTAFACGFAAGVDWPMWARVLLVACALGLLVAAAIADRKEKP